MEYLNAFLCGGLLCAIGQILIDRTQLTPARILTGYVVTGVLLQAVGVYQYLVDWGGAGATVPLTGFGYTLAKGVDSPTNFAAKIRSGQIMLYVYTTQEGKADVLAFLDAVGWWDGKKSVSPEYGLTLSAR